MNTPPRFTEAWADLVRPGPTLRDALKFIGAASAISFAALALVLAIAMGAS